MARKDAMTMWADLALRYNTMVQEATVVATDRTSKMMLGQMSDAEMRRMVVEKPFAYISSLQSGTMAMMMGGHPAWVAGAALSPIGRQTRSNANRIKRRSR